jgi:hypothetical protein
MESLLDWKRIRIRELLVATLCLSGAVSSVMFLLQDLRSRGNGSGTVMATLERMEERVRVKPAGSFAWSQIEKSDPLFRKDSIQTGEGSLASVRLKDGTMLELGENSLIVIDDLSELSLNFGQVVVRKSSGEDSQITVDRTGKKRVEAIAARLLEPVNFARMYVPWRVPAPQTEVVFRFESKATDDVSRPVALQISRDKKFSGREVVTLPLGEQERSAGKVSAQLGVGRFYWRLLNSEKRAVSTVSQFRMAGISALRPVSPQSGSPVVIWGKVGPALFRWTNPLVAQPGMSPQEAPEAGDFTDAAQILEVAIQRDFATLAASQEVLPLSGTATLPQLSAGKFFWRLRGKIGTVAVTSAPMPFEVEEGKRLPIQLAFPSADSVLELSPKQRFAWTTDALQGTDYVLELKDASGTRRSDRSPVKSYVWQALAPGKYSWRVLALNEANTIGESEWRTFTLVQGKPLIVRTPLANEEIYHWRTPPSFSFAWDPDAEIDRNPASHYVLEVSRTPDFQALVLSRKLRESRLGASDAKLVDGQYHWRVKVVSSSGEQVKVSSPRSFRVGLHPPLRAPAAEKALPREGAVVNYQEVQGGVVAQWPELEGAKAYDVVLRARGPAGAKPILSKRVTSTRVEVGEIPEGEYVLTIRGIDTIDRPGETLTRAFKTVYGSQLGAPAIRTKEVQ